MANFPATFVPLLLINTITIIDWLKVVLINENFSSMQGNVSVLQFCDTQMLKIYFHCPCILSILVSSSLPVLSIFLFSLWKLLTRIIELWYLCRRRCSQPNIPSFTTANFLSSILFLSHSNSVRSLQPGLSSGSANDDKRMEFKILVSLNWTDTMITSTFYFKLIKLSHLIHHSGNFSCQLRTTSTISIPFSKMELISYFLMRIHQIINEVQK